MMKKYFYTPDGVFQYTKDNDGNLYDKDSVWRGREGSDGVYSDENGTTLYYTDRHGDTYDSNSDVFTYSTDDNVVTDSDEVYVGTWRDE